MPDYTDDPDGEVTPLDAHIRLANPRTPETAGDLIFRAGLELLPGFDGGGQLDQGLAFVSYQRRLPQFLNTQARLAGEPLEESRALYALPGVRRDGEILGEGCSLDGPGSGARQRPGGSPWTSNIGRTLFDRLCAGRDKSQQSSRWWPVGLHQVVRLTAQRPATSRVPQLPSIMFGPPPFSGGRNLSTAGRDAAALHPRTRST